MHAVQAHARDDHVRVPDGAVLRQVRERDVIYDVKLAGSGSVIAEKVSADNIYLANGVFEFWLAGRIVLYVGVHRLISVKEA
jgi:hypothetical protein